ncbi:MAG TPA: LLM class flavin-dependent oxidoreductase [Ilumatobacteraceae bacterium]|nr:LLM class flavin-dependent oxidoreductase [Ilumatobacteraceae bacterium]HRB02716.1 LLM class flavin-dependent oxidoreductase [Ilumatobacteraceae bacterium]
MTRPCKIGVQLPEVERFVPWPELIAMARAAETVGFDSIWLGDHLLYDLPDGTVRGPWEVFTSMAALAAATTRVQIGSLVASLGFHEPAMLAKMAATVDGISGGRLILGVGAGWNQREYNAFGISYDHRVDRFEEAFGLIRRLLAGETVTHTGTYYSLDRCVVDPPASRLGGPMLMLGSNSPRMLSIGLPHVDQWNVWWTLFGNTPEGLAAVIADVRARTIAAGRAPDEVEATACVYVRVPGGAGRTMGDPTMSKIAPVAGSAEQVAEQLSAFAAVGATHLQLVVDPITQDSIEWLGQVLALLDA